MYRIVYIVISTAVILYILFSVVKTDDIPLTELKEKYTNEHSHFVEIDGLNVHYRQEGTGPNLVLLHGTASSLHTWDGWVEELKNDYTITRLDLPAFGLTGPHINRDYSIKFYTKFLNQFVQKLELDSFYLAGNSLGGGISWSYALEHPEKVKKLILVDASGYPSNDVPFVFKLARNKITSFLLTNITPHSFIEKNINEVYYNDSKVTENLIDRYYELTLAPGNRQAFVDRAKHNLIYDFKSIVEITTPTLIMWGKHDEWIPLENASKFENDLPNNTLIIYEAGHVPMEELPQETASEARKFLN